MASVKSVYHSSRLRFSVEEKRGIVACELSHSRYQANAPHYGDKPRVCAELRELRIKIKHIHQRRAFLIALFKPLNDIIL